VQVKLLRVLQERELERVGGTQTIRVDVRIVTATHRDLESMVARGEFREDLFYRLAVVPITIPPLRERGDDVALLVRHFVRELGRSCGRPGVTLDEPAVEMLAKQPWPGNVRQLQNFMERLVVLADGDALHLADVERQLGAQPASPPSAGAGAGARAEGGAALGDLSLEARRKEGERDALVQALARAGDNRTRAARLLEVSRRTLYNKMREHGLV
jgi:DNA-binding NtrC family response regulator